MALPPSTANWHWKNKNVTRWGTEWFEQELPTVTVAGDNEGEVVGISSVTEVDGDIELGQRKSKYVAWSFCRISTVILFFFFMTSALFCIFSSVVLINCNIISV
jgi:activator of HSP90 ATPase